MFGDGILKFLEGSLSRACVRRGVCEGEDVLGEGKIGIFGVLRVGTHGDGFLEETDVVSEAR